MKSFLIPKQCFSSTSLKRGLSFKAYSDGNESNKISFGKAFLTVLLGTSATGTLWFFDKEKNDEGFRRAVRLYSIAGPVVMKYRYTEYKYKLPWIRNNVSESEREKEWKDLHRQYAPEIKKLIDELQGMYVKYGQLATGLTNTFDSIWIEELRKLEDQCTPQPLSRVYKTIEEETGKEVNEVFSYFEEKPLGSASIGQVHRAVLKDSGKEVCVKVQYPDSKRLFAKDMETIRGFMLLFGPEHVIVLDELSRSTKNEFDYRKEAQALQKVNENMVKAKLVPQEAIIPLPYPEYCTERLLVMEYLKGPKLYEGLRPYMKKLAEEEGLTIEEFEDRERIRINEEGIPGPYDGPSASQIQRYKTFLRWRNRVENFAISIYNRTIGLVLGKKEFYKLIEPPNAPRIMDTLMRIHGHQVLVNGVFNADPHPGNFLLLKDDKIGLIDYGSTKELNRNERLNAAILYAALGRKDKTMLMRMIRACGYKSKYMNPDVIFDFTRLGYDTFGRDLTGEKNVQQFVDELYQKDPYEQAPDNLVMVQFLSMRIRALGMQLGHPVVCSTYWGQLAEQVLQEEGYPYDKLTDEQLAKLNEGVNIAKGAAASM